MTDPQPITKLYKESEAARFLGVQVSTLQAWRTRNTYQLKFIKVGGLVRYRQKDIDEFVERQARIGPGKGSGRKTRKKKAIRS